MPAVMSWLVFGLACVLVAAGALMGGADPVDAALALGFTPLGAYLVSRRQGGAVGACSLLTVLGAVAYAADSYAGAGLPGARWAAWVGTWVWAPPLLTVCGVLLLLVPDGRLPGRAWRPLAVANLAATALFTIAAALVPAGPERPFSVGALAPVRDALPAVVAILAATSLACAAGLVVRTARPRAGSGRNCCGSASARPRSWRGCSCRPCCRCPPPVCRSSWPCRPAWAWRCSATTCTGPGHGCAGP